MSKRIIEIHQPVRLSVWKVDRSYWVTYRSRKKFISRIVRTNGRERQRIYPSPR